jgi:hypothetical protein
VNETERLQNPAFTSAAIHSPSSGNVSFSALGEPSFSAILSTSSSLGACGSSSPGASASSAIRPGAGNRIVKWLAVRPGADFFPIAHPRLLT